MNKLAILHAFLKNESFGRLLSASYLGAAPNKHNHDSIDTGYGSYKSFKLETLENRSFIISHIDSGRSSIHWLDMLHDPNNGRGNVPADPHEVLERWLKKHYWLKREDAYFNFKWADHGFQNEAKQTQKT